MRVNAFGLAAGWKLCAKMRLSRFTPHDLSGSKPEAEKVKSDDGEVAAPVHILAVDDLRLLGMQHQLAGREAAGNRTPESGIAVRGRSRPQICSSIALCGDGVAALSWPSRGRRS